MDAVKTGKYIEEERKNLGLNKKQLASDLGISSQTIADWENGRKIPDIDILPRLANRLDTTTDNILAGEKKNENAYISPIKDDEFRLNILRKQITIFRVAGIASVVGSIIGASLFFILYFYEKKELLNSLIISSVFEAISLALFIVFYIPTKADIKEFNANNKRKIDFVPLYQPLLSVGIWFWNLAPISLITYFLFYNLELPEFLNKAWIYPAAAVVYIIFSAIFTAIARKKPNKKKKRRR